MRKNGQTINQDVENTEDDDFFEGMSDEKRELFKRALSETVESMAREFLEETEDIEIPPRSKRYKIKMNRIFRERVGGTFLPFPEADNFYERVRSKIIVKLKINEYLDRREDRRRERQK
ncbi:MAG: hypothetical protein IJO00_03180 [Clostridia bacterium]|nr:hypothetical protein [Clostridia bacterium]